MATLYELADALRGFDLDIDAETGEITNMDDLDAIEMEFRDKVENVALMVKNFLSDAEAYKREKESFAKKEQAAKNKAERLKAYLAGNLGGEKFKSDRVTISYRKSDSVEITDAAALPVKYLRTKEPEPNKAEIKKALKAGEEVSGAVLIEKESIQIK